MIRGTAGTAPALSAFAVRKHGVEGPLPDRSRP